MENEIQEIKSCKNPDTRNIYPRFFAVHIIIGRLIEILRVNTKKYPDVISGYWGLYNILKHSDSGFYVFTKLYKHSNKLNDHFIRREYPNSVGIISTYSKAGDQKEVIGDERNFSFYGQIEGRDIIESIESFLSEYLKEMTKYIPANSLMEVIENSTDKKPE